MSEDKPDIEQVMLDTLERQWDIPRSVKNAFLHEWNNDRLNSAVAILLIWRVTMCIVVFVVVKALLGAFL